MDMNFSITFNDAYFSLPHFIKKFIPFYNIFFKFINALYSIQQILRNKHFCKGVGLNFINAPILVL